MQYNTIQYNTIQSLLQSSFEPATYISISSEVPKPHDHPRPLYANFDPAVIVPQQVDELAGVVEVGYGS